MRQRRQSYQTRKRIYLSIGNSSLFLLAPHAVGSLRREEPAPPLLSSVVPSIAVCAEATGQAEEQYREEHTGDGSPHETECFLAEVRRVPAALESVAALYVDGAD